MEKVYRGILTHRRLVVVLFVAVALACARLVPLVKVNYDMVDYLPPEAQSTTAVQLMEEEFPQSIPNANVMVRNVDVARALVLKQQIVAVPGVEDVMWLDDVADVAVPLEAQDPVLVESYYKNGNALFQVTVTEGEEADAIAALRNLVDAEGAGNAVSGEAMDTGQMQMSMIEQVMMACAILVPVIVLLLVLSTSSWIEPVLFLGAIGVSILINMGTNFFLGGVSFVTNSVSPILQLAVSLDYAIFLLHAFAAERKTAATLEDAMARAMKASASTIAASAVTTLFGFGALAFMQFQIGADLGLNLVKGIVLSFFTVMVFLPALTLCLTRAIDRTTHRPLLPSFKNVGRPLAKVRPVALALVAVLVVPAFLAQSSVVFTYQNSLPDPNLRPGADTLAVQEEFGRQNAMVVLVPRGNVAAEAALSDDLAALDNITGVMGYAATVGAEIPPEFLDAAITEQFYSPHYARIIAYLDADYESDEAFAAVEAVEQAAGRYYDEFYTAGQSANLYDMRAIVSVDNVVVAVVAVVAIFLVVALTFRSVGLPLVLLLAIESGIWVNLAIPYFTGTTVNFIGYLVVNTVQLGATIDYGILLTTHYLAHRRLQPARQAVFAALGETFPSLLVSAGILASAGFALALSSAIAAVSSLGLLLGRGALISLVMVTCFLPALLVYGDGFIRRTTWRAGFFTGKGGGTGAEGGCGNGGDGSAGHFTSNNGGAAALAAESGEGR